MGHQLIALLVVAGVLIIGWVMTERFSPDPLLTTIVKVIIFIIAVAVVILQILPLAGVHI